ncbi:MAG: 4-alpha-glucanotransferase [Acidobacteriaceae bacterium]|nr:4-alpha-glucanotransferase [Acidobacteriaceae bacterium]
MQTVEFVAARDYDGAIAKAAEESGIYPEYWDVLHNRRVPSAEVMRGILQASGWDVSSLASIERERLARFEHEMVRLAPELAVVTESLKAIVITLPADEPRTVHFEIALESGKRLTGSLETAQSRIVRRVVVDGREWLGYQLNLPAEVPIGYHSLEVSVVGGARAACMLIVCPERAYIPESLAAGGSTAGFNVALYGLRSDRNWGCGDFTDLASLCDWARREIGFSFIGVNPLHALHNRAPYNTSPYLPLSMFYKNLIYIDVEAVPEFRASRCAQALRASSRIDRQIRKLRESEYVEYQQVDRLKRRFLKVLFREFRRNGGARQTRFEEYCSQEGDLLARFALYCALDEVLHARNKNRWTWKDWPAEYQDPESEACRRFAREHQRTIAFYQYIQFVIEEQLSSAQRHAKKSGMAIGLYHDLAVATDNCGSDLWAYRDYYVNGCRVGAPPDDFSPNGQDWSFPPPNARAHRLSGYRLFRESIRKLVRHGGALRIDHVMRLCRLFWIPEGAAAAQGTYVRDNAQELLGILALESVRSSTIVIGEDLGTVTDEIRRTLARFGVLSYRLFYFEKNGHDGSFKPSHEYPRQALVASSTHDLATLTGFWEGCDVEARRAAGLIDDGAYWSQIGERRRERQAMLDRLHMEGLLPHDYPRDAGQLSKVDGALHNAIVGFLARTPSMILLLNQEDLTMEQYQQNLPGSTAEYPNWQRKMKVKVEDLGAEARRGYAEMFRDQLARTGRNA